GITAPPGSLLLTLYGWAVSHVPVVHPVAFRLALGAALLAAVTSALVTWLSIHLATARARAGAAEVTAGGLVGLAFVSSRSVWMHAVQFQPYILTALFTALILAAASRWWNRARERDDGWGLFVVFLLLGLDFSVHRTNSLLLPALLVWVTLRRPRVWIRPRAMLAMGAGLVLGLGFHLLLIPLSRRDPWLDLGEPRTLGGFWSYVSLAQMGGGFLFRILPRTADFLDVQLADYLRFFRINVLPAGPGIPLTWLPGGLLLVGWGLRLRHARSERRDGRSGDLPDGTGRRLLGLLVLFLCSSVGAVVYFNLPAHYFRSMDRHYIPSLVLFAPLAAVAIAEIFRRTAARFSRQRGSARARWWWPVLVAVFLLPPLGSWWANRRDCDLSRVAFAEGCARDFLAPLPPDAILLTGGDNDTFPLWYLQRVEGVRPDVAVINVPLTNLGFYAARLGEPAWIGSPWPRDAGAQGPVSVADSTVTIPVTAGMRGGLPATVAASDTLRITLSGLLLPQDFVVLEILRASGHRPVYLASTISPSQLAWIRPFLRLDGLAY
ncbi:MAG: DUF2723 domain-containing protein, partial [Candidatus Eisenbacteria bacterium]|nr:DUF2723 domain-containing protein [Candidatus Eisenbacteria bacterium]